MDTVILILLIVAIAMLAAVLALCLKNKPHSDKDELLNLRLTVENSMKTSQNSDKLLREEMSAAISRGNESQVNTLNKIMENQRSQFLETARMQSEQLAKMMANNSEGQDKIVDTVTKGLKEIQASNEQRLEKMQAVVDEKLSKTLNERLDSNFKQIGDRLGELYKSLGELNKLSTGVGDLNKTLSNVKTRGVWGEIQLGAILEQTMISSQYDINVPTKKNSNDRVEFAVKIPSKENPNDFIYLPIDSKCPTDIYNRIVDASEAADAAATSAAVKELEQRIKTEARTIRDKYIDPPNTTDFAIMFLPTEGLYAEALRINGLSEWCQTNCKIVIAGPTTVTALLNSLRIGFSNMALNKKSQEVLKLLQAIKTQYITFGEQIEKTQKKLSDAVSSTEKLRERSDMINRRMAKIEQLDMNESNSILGIENSFSSED